MRLNRMLKALFIRNQGGAESVTRRYNYSQNPRPYRRFEEAASPAAFEARFDVGLDTIHRQRKNGVERGEPDPLPFPSTGPHGHRNRMREKLLTRGPDALADYELLEMLLFLAMPKGDTKPLAKALINRFGSFARVLAAPQQELLDTRGLGPHSVSALKLVQA